MTQQTRHTPPPAPTRAAFRIAIFVMAWAVMIGGGLIENIATTFSGAFLLILAVIVEADHVTTQRELARIQSQRRQP